MKRFNFYSKAVLLIIFVIFLTSCTKKENQQYLLLISFDGFRHDYIEKFETPNFDKFIADGSSAEFLIPSFPSKTFPNHYTIITGMYPGNHGLVDNTYYDSIRNVVFKLSKRELVEDPFFYGGKPIWLLAREQGVKTASYFWAGSEADIGGVFPDYYYRYNESVPNTDRIDQVVKWLNLPEEERPRLITVYFSFVDDMGHKFGPDSKEVENAVLEADKLIGQVMSEMRKLDLPVNILVTSDHGMKKMKTEEKTYIAIDEFLDLQDSTYRIVNNGSHIHIYTDNVHTDSLLLKIPTAHEKFSAFKKENLPSKYNYKHYRVGDILLIAKPGYYFSTSEKIAANLESGAGEEWGTHGYDSKSSSEMGGIFIANGPSIKPNHKIEAFENVHIYPFMAKLLQLEISHEIDGNEEVLNSIVK